MITFNAINVQLPDLDRQLVVEWIGQVALGYGYRVGDVNYIFVDDSEILRINRQFINHDYYTDHIGFDYTEANIISGDTYISLDTVRTNAMKFGAAYDTELHRVIIHSILHLCGIDDKEPGEREIMEAAENQSLAILSSIRHNNAETAAMQMA